MSIVKSICQLIPQSIVSTISNSVPGFRGVIAQTFAAFTQAATGLVTSGINILDSIGNSFEVALDVKDSSGGSHTVTSSVLDSDGNPFTVI